MTCRILSVAKTTGLPLNNYDDAGGMPVWEPAGG
jgi:hypothetical protein